MQVCAGGFLPRISLTSDFGHASWAKGGWSDPARVVHNSPRAGPLHCWVVPPWRPCETMLHLLRNWKNKLLNVAGRTPASVGCQRSSSGATNKPFHLQEAQNDC